MVRVLGYHSTRRKNALAIRRHGLKARKTTDHNYYGYSELSNQPVGVYVIPEPTSDRCWGTGDLRWGDDVCVVVDLLGLPVARDPEVDRARVVLSDIPPERCTIVYPKRAPKRKPNEPYHPTGWLKYEEIMEAA